MASKKANSNLLKEAIADAKAVRETALKNAELAIQEALTPRLQSIISRKIQAEMEHDGEDMDMEEELDSSDIGMGDNVEPEYTSDTELDPETDEETADVGEEDENLEVIDDLTEEDDMDDVTGASFDIDEEEEYDEDEMDLEEIIRELEDELEESDVDMGDTNMDDEDDDEEIELDLEEEDDMEMSEEEDEEFNLDEILREMGYGDDEDEMSEEDDMTNTEEMEAELEEAYKTINVLKKTINEVNLLNAKLLYANKVFRQYNLTNEQKIKIVESFDRTSTVREVKLVFATISESMKLAGSKKMKNLTEGFASKASKSTAPKGILKENVDFSVTEFQKRNQELAGIIKKN